MKIKVGGINYSVEQVPYVEISGDRNFLGSCSSSKQLIELEKGMPKDRKEQVLVHEMVHAIFSEAGFNEQDEDTVNRLGIVLHQVIKDNDLKDLLKKL